jgi:exosortase N
MPGLCANRWLITGLAFYGTLAVIALQHYIEWTSVNVLLGVLALALAIRKQPYGKVTSRYAWVALGFTALSFWLPVKTCLYFALGAAVLFVLEHFYGRQSLLPILVLGIMSPIFRYVTNVFSFPIRLQLTELAGSLLKVTGVPVKASGNVIYMHGNEFAVDPECMGLSMMVTSLLLGIMMMTVFQKKYGQTLPWWKMGLFLFAVTLLNIFSNLLRMVVLVHFAILPGSVMHDVIGMACLLVYVALPAAWMARRLGGKGAADQTAHDDIVHASNRPWKLHGVVAFMSVLAALLVMRQDQVQRDTSKAVPPVQGYNTERITPDIVKLENGESLAYIKLIKGFYNTDHHPMICWAGSGYVFEKVESRFVGGMQVYTALLKKDKAQLYTAWWYDNGLKQTTAQLDWRMDVLTGGRDYSLVNVTAGTPATLEKELENIRLEKRFNVLLQ